ncbi:MAG: SDR family oxidoreductase [Acidimicrobiales bacterium]|nr:SDR family oxidoreductase [Acidimicrobiales bacterium]
MAKRAVVTGANSGIGLATALRLARDGFEVWAGARRDEGLAAIDQAASEAGLADLRAVRLDVTDDASVAAAFGVALADGPVSVLVNNAGITGAGSVEETDIATWQAMFDTNVLGVVRCTQQVLAAMREAGEGRIVNISSSSAITSPPLMAPYATTKRAVEGISESLQAEVAPFGIRVTAIQAGTILTPIWGKNEAPPDDTAYPVAREFLLKVLSHQLMTSGVPPEAVADAIAEVVASDAPPLRVRVGDAEVLAGMRERHGDEVVDVFHLEGSDFRARYAELARVDYWA